LFVCEFVCLFVFLTLFFFWFWFCYIGCFSPPRSASRNVLDEFGFDPVARGDVYARAEFQQLPQRDRSDSLRRLTRLAAEHGAHLFNAAPQRSMSLSSSMAAAIGPSRVPVPGLTSVMRRLSQNDDDDSTVTDSPPLATRQNRDGQQHRQQHKQQQQQQQRAKQGSENPSKVVAAGAASSRPPQSRPAASQASISARKNAATRAAASGTGSPVPSSVVSEAGGSPDAGSSFFSAHSDGRPGSPRASPEVVAGLMGDPTLYYLDGGSPQFGGAAAAAGSPGLAVGRNGRHGVLGPTGVILGGTSFSVFPPDHRQRGGGGGAGAGAGSGAGAGAGGPASSRSGPLPANLFGGSYGYAGTNGGAFDDSTDLSFSPGGGGGGGGQAGADFADAAAIDSHHAHDVTPAARFFAQSFADHLSLLAPRAGKPRCIEVTEALSALRHACAYDMFNTLLGCGDPLALASVSGGRYSGGGDGGRNGGGTNGADGRRRLRVSQPGETAGGQSGAAETHTSAALLEVYLDLFVTLEDLAFPVPTGLRERAALLGALACESWAEYAEYLERGVMRLTPSVAAIVLARIEEDTGLAYVARNLAGFFFLFFLFFSFFFPFL
jgi:hypothetical protein